MKWNLLLIVALLVSCKSTNSPENITEYTLVTPLPVDESKTLQTIAFGSCSDEDEPQPMWKYVESNQADLWIWLGDIIYGDSDDPSLLAAKYDLQKVNTEYHKLIKSTPIIGIWDDHDYGENDGDKNFKIKKESKELLIDFLDVPASNPVHNREGAYQSYTFGQGDQKVKILLLDARYFRDELKRNITGHQKYQPNLTGDILGDAQWKWLEQKLTNSDAAIHIIGCGIQVIPTEHAYEKWANFPTAQKRLYDLLNQTQPNKAILLSGDRHIAEISKIQLSGLDYPLYDITSSGMTHSYEKVEQRGEPNPYRVPGTLSGQKNFAQIKIDWSSEEPSVKAEIRGLGNHILSEHTLF